MGSIVIKSLGLIFGITKTKYISDNIKVIEDQDNYILLNRKTGDIATYSKETGERLDSTREDSSPSFNYEYYVPNATELFQIISKNFINNKSGRKLSIRVLPFKDSIEILKVKECIVEQRQNFCTIVVVENKKNGTCRSEGSWFFDFNSRVDYELVFD